MGSYNGTVPTLLAGEYADANKLVEVTNYMTADTSAWTSYTSSWTSAGSAPAIGNGSIVARYRRIGKTVNVSIAVNMGSTTTYGTGEWRFSLPVAAANLFHVGGGWIFDNGLQTRPGACHLITTSTVAPDSTGGTCTGTVPQTWANGDICQVFLTYETA